MWWRKNATSRARTSEPVALGTTRIETDEAVLVVDRDSFAGAVCDLCDWTGPGRRARSMAWKDAFAHRAQTHPDALPAHRHQTGAVGHVDRPEHDR